MGCKGVSDHRKDLPPESTFIFTGIRGPTLESRHAWHVNACGVIFPRRLIAHGGVSSSQPLCLGNGSRGSRPSSLPLVISMASPADAS